MELLELLGAGSSTLCSTERGEAAAAAVGTLLSCRRLRLLLWLPPVVEQEEIAVVLLEVLESL